MSGETVFRHMSSNVTDNHTSPQKKKREKKALKNDRSVGGGGGGGRRCCGFRGQGGERCIAAHVL